jgi:peroxiredoxin
MAVKAGDYSPFDIKLKEMGEKGPQDVSVGDLFKGKKVVLFAVPGAFTPTCSMKHLPGFVEKAADIRARASTRSSAWRSTTRSSWAPGAINRRRTARCAWSADGNGEFTKALGLELDASGFGMGSARSASR